MTVVDLLVTIVVVTILVTIVLATVTYVAYKLRLSREPARHEDDPALLHYFVPYPPPEKNPAMDDAHAADTPADRERHASGA